MNIRVVSSSGQKETNEGHSGDWLLSVTLPHSWDHGLGFQCDFAVFLFVMINKCLYVSYFTFLVYY